MVKDRAVALPTLSQSNTSFVERELGRAIRMIMMRLITITPLPAVAKQPPHEHAGLVRPAAHGFWLAYRPAGTDKPAPARRSWYFLMSPVGLPWRQIKPPSPSRCTSPAISQGGQRVPHVVAEAPAATAIWSRGAALAWQGFVHLDAEPRRGQSGAHKFRCRSSEFYPGRDRRFDTPAGRATNSAPERRSLARQPADAREVTGPGTAATTLPSACAQAAVLATSSATRPLMTTVAAAAWGLVRNRCRQDGPPRYSLTSSPLLQIRAATLIVPLGRGTSTSGQDGDRRAAAAIAAWCAAVLSIPQAPPETTATSLPPAPPPASAATCTP